MFHDFFQFSAHILLKHKELKKKKEKKIFDFLIVFEMSSFPFHEDAWDMSKFWGVDKNSKWLKWNMGNVAQLHPMKKAREKKPSRQFTVIKEIDENETNIELHFQQFVDGTMCVRCGTLCAFHFVSFDWQQLVEFMHDMWSERGASAHLNKNGFVCFCTVLYKIVCSLCLFVPVNWENEKDLPELLNLYVQYQMTMHRINTTDSDVCLFLNFHIISIYSSVFFPFYCIVSCSCSIFGCEWARGNTGGGK